MNTKNIIAKILAFAVLANTFAAGCAAPIDATSRDESASVHDEPTGSDDAIHGDGASTTMTDAEMDAFLAYAHEQYPVQAPEAGTQGLPAVGGWVAKRLISAAGAELGSLAFSQLLKESGLDSDRALLEGMKGDLGSIQKEISEVRRQLVEHMDQQERYHFEQLDARVSDQFAILEVLNDTMVGFSQGKPTEEDQAKLAAIISDRAPDAVATIRRQVQPASGGPGVFHAWVKAASNSNRVSNNAAYWESVRAYQSYITQTLGMGVNLLRQAHGHDGSQSSKTRLDNAVAYSQAALEHMQITMGAPLDVAGDSCEWIQVKGSGTLYAGACTTSRATDFEPVPNSKIVYESLKEAYSPSYHGWQTFDQYSVARGLPIWKCSGTNDAKVCGMTGSYFTRLVEMNLAGRASNGSVTDGMLRTEAVGVPKYGEKFAKGARQDTLNISFDPAIRPIGEAPRGYYQVRFTDGKTGEQLSYQATPTSQWTFEIPATGTKTDRPLVMEILRATGVERVGTHKHSVRPVAESLTFVSGARPTVVHVVPKL